MFSYCKLLLIILLSVLVGFCLYCSPPLAGTATETENVIGMLYQPDGKAPAMGVLLHIRPKNTLADTSLKLAKTLTDTASTVTDKSGRYAFDTTLDTGMYVIEGSNGNNAVLIDSIIIKKRGSTDTLPPDTLKPAGTIKGIISLSEGGDPRKVFVLAFGIDRFARVNADGSFKFSGLAEAKYNLRFISSLDNYGVIDTNNISLKSADTTDLDSIKMPFMGIPTPIGLQASYDTTTRKIFLSWNKLNQGIVGGYIVYRNDSSSTIPINISGNTALKDTFFIDSVTVNPFDTINYNFQYRLKAQDTATNLGTKYSDPVRVSFKIYPIWSMVGDLTSTSAASFRGFALDNNGVPYVGFLDNFHSSLATIMRYNGTNWELVGQAGFSNGSTDNWDIKFDYNNTPYLSGMSASRAEIWHFNGSAWAMIGSLGNVNEWSVPMSIDASNIIYVALVSSNGSSASVIVQKHDTAAWSNVGDIVFSLPTTGSRANASLSLDKNGTPYVASIDETYGNKCSVKKFNGTSWEYVGTPGFSTNAIGLSSAYQTQIAMDSAGVPYVAFSNSMQVEVWRFRNSSWELIDNQSANGTNILQLFFAGNKLYVNISYDLYQFSGSVWKLIPSELHNNKYSGDAADNIFISYSGDQAPYSINVLKYK